MKPLRFTARDFEIVTGRKPEQDDLERVNCCEAGKPGHTSCGWCVRCGRPRFECRCKAKLAKRTPPGYYL